jgi:hypothetical protein
MVSVIMVSVIMVSVVMLSVVMLSVIMPNVIMLSASMLSVILVECHYAVFLLRHFPLQTVLDINMCAQVFQIEKKDKNVFCLNKKISNLEFFFIGRGRRGRI